MDHLTDDAPRLVYADWLEERDDPRGPVLRKFVLACRAGKKLPSLDGVPPAWADLTGLTITQKVVACGLRDRRNELLAFARPALRLEVGEANFDNPPPTPPAIGATRLGGDPDLPVGASYPTAANGVPLHFIGQFDLSDLQGTVAGRAFPASGLLSIFRTQSDGKNCYPTPDDCPRLVQFAPRGTRLARAARPTGLMDPPAPYRPGLRLVETLRLPGEFRKWPGVTLSDDQASEFDGVFPTNLGGTAYVLLGQVTHGNTGEEPLKDRPDWVQLVLIPYFEGPDYGVSDMSLSLHLPASDLKAGRFDRLEATFG
ncbi:MAG TPA: DUF1963 domain-containing protein [Gemmataceae bacterium]|nr:DUF1963 domain-containing protein [Gemmataceae bacterium]